MINRINKIILSLLIFSVGLFLSIGLVTTSCKAQNLANWPDSLLTGGQGAGYNTETTPDLFIAVIIKTLLSFLGVLFLILMIYGGFLWMTARGNEEQVTKSKNLIIAAIIGLIIVVTSYAISFFVIDALTKEALDFL